MSYDNWKTTDPADLEPGIPDGMVVCHHCDGEGGGRDEDGPWSCPECKGEGVVEDLTCPRCGCDPCDCDAIKAMRDSRRAA
jgi:hypothetical protein